ncbi:LysR family transcriptional regulator [Nonomuraea sp. NPDC048882]|uniref:LysR family transcriptional regulator n=1 Tax=unclassified Nonomuraea TaxID=2593643 RepID=UPI0033C15133
MDVDTRVLRYFVTVAERLSFTQAAKELFVAQPSLSRQIRQLEERLGADLFTRPEVRLTPAGEQLLTAARRHLAEWQETTRLVRTTAAADRNVLRVGFVVAGGGPLARRARTALTTCHPEATVEPKRFEWAGETQALRDGQVDVAFVWLPADLIGLCSEVVATEPRCVAVAATHPLAERESVGIADLRDEPIGWTRVAPAEWVDWWAVNPRPDGSAPVWGPKNDNVDEMLEHVATGAAVCIGVRSMAEYYAHPELKWLPITDIEPLRIALAWPPGTINPLVGEFVRIVREVATG